MTVTQKIRTALDDLLVADLKEEDGAIASASTHRAMAIVTLLSVCPGYEAAPDTYDILEQRIEEMVRLGIFGYLVQSPTEDESE